jgi:hypothetical protein
MNRQEKIDLFFKNNSYYTSYYELDEQMRIIYETDYNRNNISEKKYCGNNLIFNLENQYSLYMKGDPRMCKNTDFVVLNLIG